MAKGLPHNTGDPNIKTGTFPTLPDREYQANKINKFISVDATGNPIFIEQNGRMIVRFELGTVDGKEFAVGATCSEFWAIVNAFGVDVSTVTKPEFKMSSESLTRAQAAVNKGSKVLNVPVKNGWANGDRIPEALPPAGNYVVKFVGAHRPDRKANDLTFQELNGQFGKMESLIFDFEILRSAFGKSTAFDGYIISVFMNNPFCDSYVTPEGQHVEASAMGVPLYARNESNGGIPANAVAWDIFAKYFAPGLAEHDWKIAAVESEYNVSEVYMPQYVYIGEALKAKREVIVYFKDKTKGRGRTIYMTDVPNLNDLPEPPAIQLDPVQKPLDNLTGYITQRWPDVTVFDDKSPTIAFTDAGRAWAKEVFGGDNSPWIAAGLSVGADKPSLHQLTDDQATKLLEEIKNRYPLADKVW